MEDKEKKVILGDDQKDSSDEDKNLDGQDKKDSDDDQKGDKGDESEESYFKKENEKLKTKLGKAEYTIEKLKKKGEKKDEDDDEDDDEDEENKPVTKKELLGILNTHTKNLTQGAVKAKIRATSSSDDEASVVEYHYNHSIISTGDIDEDIDNARLIANKGRIKKQMSELVRTANSNGTKTTGDGGNGQKPPKTLSRPTLDPTTERTLALKGYQWDGKKGVFFRMSGTKRLEWNPTS